MFWSGDLAYRDADGWIGQFLASQPDLSPKAWPRYVWLTDRLPTTATNKILKRELTARGAAPGSGVLWTRSGQSRTYTRPDRHIDADA